MRWVTTWVQVKHLKNGDVHEMKYQGFVETGKSKVQNRTKKENRGGYQ